MKIGVIYDGTFPPDQRVEKEAVSLIKRNFEVVLFSPNYSKLPGVEEYKRIRIRRVPAGKLLYKLSALACDLPFYNKMMAPKISKFIAEEKVDVLHVHDMVIAQAAMDANRKFRLPLVLDLHENRPEIMRAYRYVNTFPGKWLVNLKRWANTYQALAAKADRIVVVSESAKSDIVQLANRKPSDVVVVPNTMEPGFMDAPVEKSIVERMKGSYNLIYVGDTSLRRGTDTAIEAVALLRDRIPDLRLWLIGRSSGDAELKKMVVAFKVEQYVFMEGWKSDKLFPSYLSASHICLSPLKRNRHHDTTYANKVFQYMMAAKPLLVSDCTEQANLVTNTRCGLVHQAEDPKDMAAKIFELYQDAASAAMMGENGKRAIDEYWNWDNTIVPMLNMYEKVIRNS